jgi:transcriptional regulator with XRE-family HTH domain
MRYYISYESAGVKTPSPESRASMITPKQIRAARALLGIGQIELASSSGVSIATIRRIEASNDNMRVLLETMVRIQRALEAEGIVFIETDEMVGVALRSKQ